MTLAFEISTEVKKPVRRPRKKVQSTITEVTQVDPIIGTCPQSISDQLANWITKETNPGNYAFNIAVRNETGKITLHPRTHQPCWGELRTHYNDIHKPSDLYNPFPEGTPVGIAIWTMHRDQELLAWMLSHESPWKNILGRCGVRHILEENKIKGFILQDMDIDPTVLGSMLLNLKGGNHPELQRKLIDAGIQSAIAYFIAYSTCLYNKYSWNAYGIDYYIVKKINLKRFINGNHRQITIDANTFTERGAYNRKEVHNLFTDEEAKSLRQMYGKKYPELTFDVLVKIGKDLMSKYL